MIDGMTHSLNEPSDIKKQDIFSLIFAFVILLLSIYLPPSYGLTRNSQIMIGILIMAAMLWITEPIPLPATGILIMILQPMLGLIPADKVFSSFGNQAVFFLIGAFIIAGAIEKQGLHRRIALGFLKRFENNPRIFTFGIIFSSALLSFIIPGHGVAALFLPIITSILLAMRVIPKESNFGKISMLSVAYGSSIGSLGTLVGGARNPLTVGILSNHGINISFMQWMIYAVPIVLIAIPVVWFLLQIVFPIEVLDISLAKKKIEEQLAAQGSINRDEVKTAGILLFTIILWFLFSNSDFGLAGIALLGSFLLFLTKCISWKDVEQRLPWGIILMYGGAITLGVGLEETGAGGWIAQTMLTFMRGNPFFIILGIILVTVILTNVMSNTGAVAVLLPIGISLAYELPSISPLLASMLIALSGGFAFMFIIATPANAIAYSSGYLSMRDLLKAGVFANIACVIIIYTIALIYWRGVLGL